MLGISPRNGLQMHRWSGPLWEGLKGKFHGEETVVWDIAVCEQFPELESGERAF